MYDWKEIKRSNDRGDGYGKYRRKDVWCICPLAVELGNTLLVRIVKIVFDTVQLFDTVFNTVQL